MIKKSAKSAKAKVAPAKAKASKKAAKPKIDSSTTSDLRAAAKASALRRLKKLQ